MVVQHLHTVPGVSSNLTFTTKFCKCQQVKDTLRRYFEGRLSVEQRAGSVPVLEHNGMHWSSIPSDVPSPARVYYTGEWLL
jgi:hypothetical protein